VRTNSFRPIVILGALTICVALTACGRKGALEGPPGSNLPRLRRDSQRSAPVTPESVGKQATTGFVIPPKTHFLLDPLL
jgi:predicted small lipoprotein YifL